MRFDLVQSGNQRRYPITIGHESCRRNSDHLIHCNRPAEQSGHFPVNFAVAG